MSEMFWNGAIEFGGFLEFVCLVSTLWRHALEFDKQFCWH